MLCPNPRHQSRYRTLLEKDAWDELASEFSGRVGGPIDPNALAAECGRFKKAGDQSWRDASWACWLMNRASAVVEWTPSPVENDQRFSCELHVGFVTVYEPQWMVEFLKSLKDEVIPVKWSKSGVPFAIVALSPIDALAAKVAFNVKKRRSKPQDENN